MIKLVDALAKTEKPENEECAVKPLQEWFEKTKQYRFRKMIGVIRIKQMIREEKTRHKAMTNDPGIAAGLRRIQGPSGGI